MKELIKINTNENGEQLVSGRELHEYLGVKTQYTKWFERMSEYGFTENVDFTSFSQKCLKPDGGRPEQDHAMKLDMAKEISMIQRTERGKQARRYFIEIEKQHKQQLPTTYKEALLQLVEQVEKSEKLEERALIAEQINLELQPKADYCDKILANKGLVTVSTIAKNYGMSAVAFNKLLHDLGVQYNQSGTWLLYSKYQDKGYTHTEPFGYLDSDGNEQVRTRTKWTQKGHLFLYELLKRNGTYPMIEQKRTA